MRRLSPFNYRLGKEEEDKCCKRGESAGRGRDGGEVEESCRNSAGQGSTKGLIKFSGKGSKRDNSKITVKTSQKDPTQQGELAKRTHVCVGKANGRQKGQ